MKNLPVLMTLAVLAASAVAATPAHASDGRRTETVRYGDLDLSNAEGAGTLFHRLHSAAAEVCAQPAGDGLLAVPLYHRCLADAMGEAIEAVDQPAVTAYAQAHGVGSRALRAN